MSVLGVSKSASAADIKSAYRKLAKKLHPDANKSDPKAASRFSELNAAYEIVGDDDKRKAFDRGEIDAEGKPRFQGFEGFGGGGRAAVPAGRSAARTASSRPSPGGRKACSARAAARRRWRRRRRRLRGHAARHVRRRRAARGAAVAAVSSSRKRSSRRRPAATSPATATITLEEAAKGTTRRVQLPTGKELEVKIPAGLADGQRSG